MDKIKFDDIIDIAKFQVIQDYFAQVLGLSLIVINPKGLTLTRPSGPVSFTSRIFRCSIEMRFEERFNCLCGKRTCDWREGNRCHDHFYDFAVPLKAGGKILAYVIAGPVIIGKRGDREKYLKMAAFFNVNEQDFSNAVRETKVFSFNGIRQAVELIHEVGCALCESGYKNYQMRFVKKEIRQAIDGVISQYSEQMLNSFLETSFSCLEADRASLMLWDKKDKELYIKKAKGLHKDIIRKVRVKLGQGLSGLAAEREEPLFIDQSRPDQGLAERMTNPGLQKAFLLPFKVKNKLFGVLNLASSSLENRAFSSQNLDTVRGLARLVETTLSSL